MNFRIRYFLLSSVFCWMNIYSVYAVDMQQYVYTKSDIALVQTYFGTIPLPPVMIEETPEGEGIYKKLASMKYLRYPDGSTSDFIIYIRPDSFFGTATFQQVMIHEITHLVIIKNKLNQKSYDIEYFPCMAEALLFFENNPDKFCFEGNFVLYWRYKIPTYMKQWKEQFGKWSVLK